MTIRSVKRLNSMVTSAGRRKYSFALSGYFFCGAINTTQSTNGLDSVEKINTSSDTISTVGRTIALLKDHSAFASSDNAYVAGGFVDFFGTPATLGTIYKFSFASESVVYSAAVLTGKSNGCAFSSSTFGLYAGGIVSGSNVSSIDKYTFSTDVKSNSTATLSNLVSFSAGYQSSTTGYSAGGLVGSNFVTTVDKILFSDETRATMSTGLSEARVAAVGFNSSTHGYVATGRLTSSASTVVDKFAFSNDGRTAFPTGLANGRRDAASFSSVEHGYIGGGENTPLTTIQKWNTTTDVASIAGVSLTVARRAFAATAPPISISLWRTS